MSNEAGRGYINDEDEIIEQEDIKDFRPKAEDIEQVLTSAEINDIRYHSKCIEVGKKENEILPRPL